MNVRDMHPSPESIGRLLRKELTPQEVARTMRHVSACETCQRENARAFAGELEALAASMDEPPEHIAPETLRAFARGTLDAADREIVESHLDDCGNCRAALAKRPTPWRWIAVAAAIVIAVLIAIVPARRTKRPRPADAPVVHVAPPAPAPTATREEPNPLVALALAQHRLPFPVDLDELRGSEDPLRGTSTSPRAQLSPAGVVIDAIEPAFTWPATAGATYVVSVFEGETERAVSGELRQPHWTTTLARGRTYTWQVEVRHGDDVRVLPEPPAPQARFRIASRHDHDAIAEARRVHPDDFLLHAVLYAKAGLKEEALAALRRAARDRADAQQLLEAVR